MSEWNPSETLPSRDDGEQFQVYLAFDDGNVKHAEWHAYTEYASEYHATTGVYLGQYPQDADAFYMTEDGFEVRQDNEGGFWFYFTYPDGLEKPQLGPRVTAWMEALKPTPAHPSRKLDRLTNAIVENILATSDEDILADSREDGELCPVCDNQAYTPGTQCKCCGCGGSV